MNTNLLRNNNSNGQSNIKGLSNSKMLSRQIDNLRVVLRRVKKNDFSSSSLDSLIDQKLKAVQ